MTGSGFEARRLVFGLLDAVMVDPSLTIDAMIYESREPDVLGRLEKLGPRLRALVDDHGENARHGQPREHLRCPPECGWCPSA